MIFIQYKCQIVKYNSSGHLGVQQLDLHPLADLLESRGGFVQDVLDLLLLGLLLVELPVVLREYGFCVEFLPEV